MFPGLLVLLGFISFYWVLLRFTSFYWTGFYCFFMLLGLTRFNRVSQVFTGFHSFQPDIVLLNVTWNYRV